MQGQLRKLCSKLNRIKLRISDQKRITYFLKRGWKIWIYSNLFNTWRASLWKVKFISTRKVSFLFWIIFVNSVSFVYFWQEYFLWIQLIIKIKITFFHWKPFIISKNIERLLENETFSILNSIMRLRLIAVKIFRVFIECSAKDQHGLNRIIEEIVWTLIVKGQNPMMSSLMPSSGSVGANLSLSVSKIFFLLKTGMYNKAKNQLINI